MIRNEKKKVDYTSRNDCIPFPSLYSLLVRSDDCYCSHLGIEYHIYMENQGQGAYPVWKTPTCVVSKEEINEVFFGEIPDSSLI